MLAFSVPSTIPSAMGVIVIFVVDTPAGKLYVLGVTKSTQLVAVPVLVIFTVVATAKSAVI